MSSDMTVPVMVGCTCNAGTVYEDGLIPRPCPRCGGTGTVPADGHASCREADPEWRAKWGLPPLEQEGKAA